MASLKILVVDDNVIIGALVADMLESMGHFVCGVEATEDDAVSAAAAQQPNLIIVDAKLGCGSGIEAMRRIQRTSGAVAHVFISGASVPAASPHSVVLQKPFVEADLVRAIARALQDPIHKS